MFNSCYPRGTSFWFSEGIVVSRSSWYASCVFGILFLCLGIIVNVNLSFVLLVQKYFVCFGLGCRWGIWSGKYDRWFEVYFPLVFVFRMSVIVFPVHIQFCKISSFVKLIQVVEFR